MTSEAAIVLVALMFTILAGFATGILADFRLERLETAVGDHEARLQHLEERPLRPGL